MGVLMSQSEHVVNSGPDQAGAAAASGPDALSALGDLEKGLASLKRLYDERRELEQRLLQTQATLRAREEALSTRDDELRQARESEAVRQKELAELQSAITQQQQSLEGRRAELDQLTQSIEERRRQIDESAREYERRQSEEAARAKAIADELNTFASELQRLQAELEEGKRDLEQQRSALREAAGVIKSREQELQSRSDELGLRVSELDEERRTLAQVRESQTQAQSDEQLRAQEQAALLMQQDLEQVTRRCAAQESVLVEYEQLLALERSHVHELVQQLHDARTGPAELDAIVAEVRTRLARESESRAGAESRVESALRERDEARTLAAAVQEQLRQRDDELLSARRTGEEAARRLAALAQGRPIGEGTPLRRERLRRCKSILRDQARKVRRASEVLAKRFEQCEQVLAQRSDLLNVKRALDQQAARLARAQAAKRSLALVLYALVIVAILGVLSWSAVNQTVPGLYAASAQISADGRGRELSDPELEEWKRTIEEMLADPRFLDLLADRMRQRGLEAFATPVAVRQLLKDSLTHNSPQPGTLAFELRALGSQRASRSLDVLTTTLASEANATRERRADGAVTIIKDVATSGNAPLDDRRVVHAAILLVISSTLTLGLGTLLWTRLARSKQQFEQGSQIEMVLDEARWSEFAAATTRSRPTSPGTPDRTG